MHKILLINLPIDNFSYNFLIPEGPLYCAAALEQAGYEIDFWDININYHSPENYNELIDALENKDTDYLAIAMGGLITAYNFVAWFTPHLRRKYPDTALIVGGGIASECSDLLLYKQFADITVLGEGESTICDIADNLRDGRDTVGIPGTALLKNGKLKQYPPRPLIQNLDDNYPAYHCIDPELYLNRARTATGRAIFTLNTSRGCPFNCNFCYHIFGRSYRHIGNDEIIRRLKQLKSQFSPESFVFIDEMFLASKKRFTDFCNQYVHSGIDTPWWFKTRVDMVLGSEGKALLQLAATSGCEYIGFGFESGSQEILDRMNKRTAVWQMSEAIDNVVNSGIPRSYGGIIVGYPGETPRTVNETITFMNNHPFPDYSVYYATPYPGTEMYPLSKAFARHLISQLI